MNTTKPLVFEGCYRLFLVARAGYDSSIIIILVLFLFLVVVVVVLFVEVSEAAVFAAKDVVIIALPANLVVLATGTAAPHVAAAVAGRGVIENTIKIESAKSIPAANTERRVVIGAPTRATKAAFGLVF